IDMPLPKGAKPITRLKADKEKGSIVVDTETTLTGIPSEAWTYKLGNRSAVEWVLDQHKEKSTTLAVPLKGYRFADYKEEVINLLGRVVAVSVNTIAIIREMRPSADGEE